MLVLQEAKNPDLEKSRLESLLSSVGQKRFITMIVEPHADCNLSCTFCDLHSGRIQDTERFKGEMSTETFERIVKQLAVQGYKLKELQFHGNGEPLLNKNLPEFVRYAKQYGVAEKYRLTTNGTMLTPKNLRSVVESGIDTIHVSLDVVDRDRYRELKGKDLYLKVEENIGFAIDFLEEHKRCELFIKYAIPNEDDKYGFTHQEMEAVINQYRQRAEHSAFVHLKGVPVVTMLDGYIHDKNVKFDNPCELPFYSCFVKFDGSVSACCADVFGDLAIGNIRDQDLTDIVNSKELRHIRYCHLKHEFEKLPICLYCCNRICVDIDTITDDLIKLI